jgi:hypothetical protein
MNPEKNQYVIIIFKNGLQSEGYVESWSDKKSVLKSIDSLTYFVIQNTDQDVMAFKILLNPSILKPQKQLQEELKEIKSSFNEEVKKPSQNIEDNLRMKNLAQLKQAMIEQEKKIEQAKLREHNFCGLPNKGNYEHGLFKK